jgi:hypothetical protein
MFSLQWLAEVISQYVDIEDQFEIGLLINLVCKYT